MSTVNYRSPEHKLLEETALTLYVFSIITPYQGGQAPGNNKELNISLPQYAISPKPKFPANQ